MTVLTNNLHLLLIGGDRDVHAAIKSSLSDEPDLLTIRHVEILPGAGNQLITDHEFDAVLIDLPQLATDDENLHSWIKEIAESTPVIVLTDDDYDPIPELSCCNHLVDFVPRTKLDTYLLKKCISYSLERKEVSKYLKKSEEQYKEFFEINPVPMFLYDWDSYKFLDVNKAAIETYGYSREEFLAMTIKDIRPKSELPKLEKILRENRANEHLTYSGTFTHIKKNGEPIQVEIQSKFTTVNGKKAKLVLVNNVTDRLKAQEALKLSEQRFKSLVQGGSDMITIINEEAVYQYVSPTSQPILGILPETFVGTNAFHYIHKDDRARVLDELATLPQKKHIRLTPFRHIDDKNNWRWLDSTITYMLDDPAIQGIVTNSRDITEKVEQELKLKESMSRYDIISKATSDTIWDLDIARDIVTYNDAVREMFGYEQMVVRNARKWWESKIHPDDFQSVMDKFDEILKKGITRFQLVYRFQCADGNYKYIFDRATIVTDKEGKPLRIIGAAQDMTELLNKKKELQKANEQLKIAQKIAKAGYWTHNLRENRITWSEEAIQIWELDPESIPMTFVELIPHIYPDDRHLLLADREQSFPGNDFTDIEFRIITSSGRIKWIMSRITLHRDENGSPYLVEGVSQDINEKKEQELQLKETIDRYEILSMATSDAIWDMDIRNNTIYYNHTATEMFGYDQSEIINTLEWWQSKIHPHDREKVISTFEQAFSNGVQRLQLDFRYMCADGSYKHIYARAFLIMDTDGKPVRMSGAMQDMTELLEKKKELQKANEQLKTAHRIAKMGYWTANLADNIGEWSEEVCNIYGVDPENFAPNRQTWMELIHPDDRESVDTNFKKIFENHSYHDFDHRIITSDGVVKWIVERITLHRNKDGKPVSLEGISQDITDRKIQEGKVLAALKEKETLLAEIHHRVKNNLAVVSSLMQLQAFEEENCDLSYKLLDSVSRIKTMATIHEQLYQSNNFANLEFCRNLKKLVLSVTETFRSDTHISHSFECKPIQLNITQAVPCALIVNEVVTNILKHAFKGRDHGKISINFTRERSRLTLEIADDGVGMPDYINPSSGKTLGLHLIDTLSKQLEAEYHFESSKNKGTRFVLQFEKKQ